MYFYIGRFLCKTNYGQRRALPLSYVHIAPPGSAAFDMRKHLFIFAYARVARMVVRLAACADYNFDGVLYHQDGVALKTRSRIFLSA